MSMELLKHLNGNRNGHFRRFLEQCESAPRIAWYPSAGEDMRPLLYLSDQYNNHNPPNGVALQSPDIFLFTDYYPWQSTFLDNRCIYQDGRTRIEVRHIEELPRLMLPLHAQIVDFPRGSSATDRIVYLEIEVRSTNLGSYTCRLLYAFAENESFYWHKLVQYNAHVSNIIHVRYGGGVGGGGKASGIWLNYVLGQLNTEILITDNHGEWQIGDNYAVENVFQNFNRNQEPNFQTIRTIGEWCWSNHGTIHWNKVANNR